MLALELGDSVIRAAVVRGGPGRYVVTTCFEIPRLGGQYGSDAPLVSEEVAAVMKRLGGKADKFVLVGQDVRTAHLDMESSKLKAMKPLQIKEALRWEAEAYTGISGSEAMVGYELIGDWRSGKRADVQVSVCTADFYRQIKDIFSAVGLKLRRVYCEEACFPSAALSQSSRNELIVAHVGELTTKVVHIRSGQPVAFSSTAVGAEAVKSYLKDESTSGDLEDRLREPFVSIKTDDAELIVCGPGGCDESVVAFTGLSAGMKASPLRMQGEAMANRSDAPLYATAVGAAIRELGYVKNGRLAGITDAVPLGKQLRNRIHVFPIVIVALLLAVFMGLHLMNHHQRTENEKSLAQAKTQLKKLKDKHAYYNALKRQLSTLRKTERRIQARQRFLDSGACGRIDLMEKFLDSLTKLVPQDMRLCEICKEGENRYVLHGEALSAGALNSLATALQNESWCLSASSKNVSRKTGKTQDAGQIYIGSIDVLLSGKGRK